MEKKSNVVVNISKISNTIPSCICFPNKEIWKFGFILHKVKMKAFNCLN